MIGAAFDGLSPNALVSVLSKRKSGPPPRYLSEHVLGVTYTDSGTSKASKLAVKLLNVDNWITNDKDLVRKGTVMGFNYGYPGLMIDAGQFVIKGHSGQLGAGGVITITADARKRGKFTRKKLSRKWPPGTTRSAAVREVLSNHFAADELHIEDTTRAPRTIIQRGEHDWQFCTRQAYLAGFEFWIDQEGVHWAKPRRDQRPTRLIRAKNAIGRGEIIARPTFKELSTGIPGRIVLKGKDFITKKPFVVEVTPENVSDLGELVEPARIETPEQGDREDRGDTGNEIVRYTGATSEAAAREQAEAMLKAQRWGAVNMQVPTFGDPTVRARTIVVVQGLGAAADGMWWVKNVKNQFGPGYTQSLDLTREGLAKRLKIRKGTPKTATQEQDDVERDPAGAMRGYETSRAPI